MKKVTIVKNGEKFFESNNYFNYYEEVIINYAYLRGADLSGADLRGAYLSRADLSGADLSRADLRGAYLSGADLSRADLSRADLSGADLSRADLRGAYLSEDEEIRKGKILEKEIVGYKKCKNKIVKLKIPKGAIVFSINNHKCRTNIARVISIDGSKEKGLKIESNYDGNFVYEVGRLLSVKEFNLMYNIECASGIHFFMNEEDAREYNQ